MDIRVIAFDADDTLWVNEPYYQNTEAKFCSLLEEYLPAHSVSAELLKTEIANLPLYGYGVKGFILSMIETALKISNYSISNQAIEKIMAYGKDLLNEPIELLDDVEYVLTELKKDFKLVVATKGDLLDQERKLKKSGLSSYFHHIEIMSEKNVEGYSKLINHLDIKPSEFMMVGNSLKSDILPVLDIGAYGIHIPYHTTWAHEHVEARVEHQNFWHVSTITAILPILQ